VLFPEATKVLDTVREKYRLALITNGVPDIQWKKINGCGIGSYFEKIVISGEVNVAKPNKDIFQRAFDHFEKDKEKYIMIGNSLNRDIGGARNAGITSAWINRNNAKNDGTHQPDFEINNLEELYSILGTT
jgi:putative hydrolase of the HAD superfamily